MDNVVVVKKPSNTYAIVGMVLSCTGLLILSKWFSIPGIILGIVGLGKASDYVKKHRGLSLAAIIIGGCALLINLIVGIIGAFFSFGLTLLW